MDDAVILLSGIAPLSMPNGPLVQGRPDNINTSILIIIYHRTMCKMCQGLKSTVNMGVVKSGERAVTSKAWGLGPTEGPHKL